MTALEFDSSRARIEIEYAVGDSAEAGEPEEHAEHCAMRFFDVARDLWFAGQDTDYLLERARVQRIGCLGEQGVEVDADTAWEDLVPYTDQADLLILVACEDSG